jgi:hypothetical protein
MLVADAYLGERLREKEVQAFGDLNEGPALGAYGFLLRLARTAAANLIQLVAPIGRRRYGLRQRFAPFLLGARASDRHPSCSILDGPALPFADSRVSSAVTNHPLMMT